MPPAATRRRFRIDPHAIKTLIGAQAGSLQKALLEGVANAIDAGAARIDVEISAKRVSLIDDGSGMDGRAIEEYFEVFGFDHAHLGRQVGRFGVGRGQLFCFGKNTWTTTGYKMAVDIEKDGLDYELGKLPAPVKGTRIDIDLYKPLTPFDRNTVETELRRLVRYAVVPVFLNGKPISEDPVKKKGWAHETADGWFTLNRDSELNVYSQGLLVCSIPRYRYGAGGEVVTKPGRALAQNLARNEIMEQNCEVWKRLSKAVRAKATALRDDASKKGTLTSDMRKSLAAEVLAKENPRALLDEALFTLSNGKHVRLMALLRRATVAVAPTRSVVADKIMQRGAGIVLDPVTLDRFRVETPAELKNRLLEVLSAAVPHGGVDIYAAYKYESVQAALVDCRFHDTIDELAAGMTEEYTVVPDSKLSPHEKAMLRALRRQSPMLARQVNKSLNLSSRSNEARSNRSIEAMESPAFDACTDGSRTIWINRARLRAATQLPGVMRLTHLLVHEYLHTDASYVGHQHDGDFYEAFHDLTLDSKVAEIGLMIFGSFVRGGPAPSRPQLQQLSATLDVGDDDVGTGELLADPEPAPAPVRRRPRP